MTKEIMNKPDGLYLCDTENSETEQPKKVANYTLEPIAIINQILSTKNRHEIVEFLALTLTKGKYHKKRFIKLISGSDEEDVKSFVKALHKGVVGLSESFSKSIFWKIKEMLYENIKTINIYKNYGYQPTENIFVFSNKIFDLNHSELLEYPNISTELKLTEQEKEQILTHKYPKPVYFHSDNPKKILTEFFVTIAKVYNDSAVLVAVGVCVGVLFFDLFIKHAQGFPYIFLYGQPTSGKTTLMYCLAAIFGFVNHTELTSGTSTITVIREGLSNLNNVMFFIDELDKSLIEKLENLGKDTYSGTPRKKSSKDGTEIITDINTSFCITTNNFFENITFANFSRSILVDMPKDRFELSNFKYHSAEELKKLSSMLPLILSYRSKIIEIYNQQFKIAQNFCTQSRLCNNVAIGMAMWSVINDIVGFEVVNTEQLAKEYFEYFERYLDTELNYGDVFLADIYRLFVKDELIFGRDFLITRSKFLRINLKKYCDIFNSLNERQKLNTAQLKLKLANDKRFNLKSSDLKPIGKAIKIDISENEILLDILNRVMPVNSAEGEDD